MSYQPPQLPAGPPPGQGAEGGAPRPDTALLDALIARNLEQVPAELASSATPLEGFPSLPNPDPNSAPPLYGEPPGWGYLYARDPQARQRAMVATDPEMARDMLLRAIETCAQNALLPFSEEGAEKLAKAALAFSQAYLLIDPAVDAQGVPVEAKAAAQAAGQATNTLVQAHSQPPQAAGAGASRTTPTGTEVSKGKSVGGHQAPPRIRGSHAAALLAEAMQPVQTMLQTSRGSTPRPRPRVGA